MEGESLNTSLEGGMGSVGLRLGMAMPEAFLTALSSQHAAKQAAASATQTIAAAQHATSTPKASAGPQPLLAQSCKVRPHDVCWGKRRCGRRGTFP